MSDPKTPEPHEGGRPAPRRTSRVAGALVLVLAILGLIPSLRGPLLQRLGLADLDHEAIELAQRAIEAELAERVSKGMPRPADVRIVPTGLTNAELQRTWHRTPEGSDVFPVALFFALEDPTTGRPLIESMDRFGFIPPPGGDGDLPVGFSRVRSPKGDFVLTGFNCAACHSSQITFGGKTLHIDGAPNLIDTEAFYRGVLDASEALLKPEAGRKRFEFVLRFLYYNAMELKKLDGVPSGTAGSGSVSSPNRMAGTAVERYETGIAFLKQRIATVHRISESFRDHSPGGPGRADSFGIIRNMMMTKELLGQSGNFRPMNAPVSIPHLFNFGTFTNLHWDGNTTTGNDRNYAQAIALGADFDPVSKASSVRPAGLYAMEKTAWMLRPPKWPVDTFGPLDAARVARGRALFRSQSCVDCHERETWTPVTKVGTDPNRLAGYNEPLRVAGNRSESYALNLQRSALAIKLKAYEDHQVPQALREAMDARHPGVKQDWIDTLDKGYLSRPLAGLWATAPFLHNGSVPTLWDLLQPAVRRPKRFPVGHRDFDPVKVGFVDRPARVVWEFDTSANGNRNTGHEYGTALTDDQKWDLIEYLKSL